MVAPAVRAATAQQLGRYMTPPLLAFRRTHPFGCCTLEPWVRGKGTSQASKDAILTRTMDFSRMLFSLPLSWVPRRVTSQPDLQTIFLLFYHVLTPVLTCSHAELNLEKPKAER